MTEDIRVTIYCSTKEQKEKIQNLIRNIKITLKRQVTPLNTSLITEEIIKAVVTVVLFLFFIATISGVNNRNRY
jgi:hypothetical protein